MILVTGLKRVCDISFYMTFATIFAWIFNHSSATGLAITLPIFMTTAFLAAYLADRWGIARFLALIPLLSVFVLVEMTTINILVLIPAMILMVYHFPKPSERGSKHEYQQTFKLFFQVFLGVILSFLLFLFVANNGGAVRAGGAIEAIPFSYDILIFALSFTFGSIVYMRMVRHDLNIQQQTQFKIKNSLPIIGLAIAAIVVSNEFVLGSINWVVGGFFYLLWIRGIARIFPWIGDWVTIPFRHMTFKPPPWDPEYDYFEEPLWYDGEHDLNYSNFLPVDNNGGLILVTVLIVLGLILLFRQFLKQHVAPVSTEAGLVEERIMLDEDTKRKFGQRRHENQIRAWYQRFLKVLKQNNFPTPISATSLEIERIAATKANPEHLSSLRNLYARVRYGGATFSKADVANAKELYRQIKDEIES